MHHVDAALVLKYGRLPSAYSSTRIATIQYSIVCVSLLPLHITVISLAPDRKTYGTKSLNKSTWWDGRALRGNRGDNGNVVDLQDR